MPLHPILAATIDSVRAAGIPSLAVADSVAGARDALEQSAATMLSAGPDLDRIEPLSVPTRAGHALRCRAYWGARDPAGVTIYVHGGGWCIGSLDSFDNFARNLAARTSSLVVSVDYRLAPEHPFPAGLHDVEDALTWLTSSWGEARERPVVVAGDSTGANLVSAALLGSDLAASVALQVLMYPVANCDFDAPSYLQHSEEVLLGRADMQWFFRHYAPSDLWSDRRISLVNAPDLGSSPETWIAVAEYDVLRHDGVLLAQRLDEAGVKVASREFAGMTHGFMRLHETVDVADRALDEVANVIRQAHDAQAPSLRPVAGDWSAGSESIVTE